MEQKKNQKKWVNLLLWNLALCVIITAAGCQSSNFLSIPEKKHVPPHSFPAVPYDSLSTDSMYSYLNDLTSIQPYSGWRNSASSGEADALDYVEEQLATFSNLNTHGMEIERQAFKVYSGVEMWTTELRLTLNGAEVDVPADGLRGSRYDPEIALSMDSDGLANDSVRNPVEAAGTILMVREIEQLNSLSADDIKNQILFLDYALIDAAINEDFFANGEQIINLIEKGLSGLVLVTQYSNVEGESRGSFVGDGSIFQWINHSQRIPILYVRLEDLNKVGIMDWQALEKIESARLIWDTDVFMPGTSGNLILRIPGVDPSKAVLLSAHIDSPNGPGAFDDGSGSAILLEITRVLNKTQIQPAVDLYIVWYGGHELGTYGSSYFVSTHQELLDRLLAMLVIDPVGMPLNGKEINISASYSSYQGFGDDRALWPDFLTSSRTTHGVSIRQEDFIGQIADNSNFDPFNVPNINLSVLDYEDWMAKGSSYAHYANHWHDPYETVELAKEVDEVFLQVSKVALSAALETGREVIPLTITPKNKHHALFIASHTENATIAPALMQDLGMALAWEGFDVDLIPYGQTVSESDLRDVEIVVLLPTLDYPGPNLETWSNEEMNLLTAYVDQGGFLLVTNSASSLASARRVEETNEEATDLNRLLIPMGIEFKEGYRNGGNLRIVEDHKLTKNVEKLSSWLTDNLVPVKFSSGLELSNGAIGLVNYGKHNGQVLVVSDIGLLKNKSEDVQNLQFVKNIAAYAAKR